MTDGGDEAAVAELDGAIWRREAERLYENPFDPKVVRVYVYEMPRRFTYDLLWLFRNTYKETTNLTSNGSPVHRLIEQVWFLFAADLWKVVFLRNFTVCLDLQWIFSSVLFLDK